MNWILLSLLTLVRLFLGDVNKFLSQVERILTD